MVESGYTLHFFSVCPLSPSYLVPLQESSHESVLRQEALTLHSLGVTEELPLLYQGRIFIPVVF